MFSRGKFTQEEMHTQNEQELIILIRAQEHMEIQKTAVQRWLVRTI